MLPHGLDERPLDLGAGRRAAGVHDPRPCEWPPSRASSKPAVLVDVEDRAERDQLVDAARALVDQHADGVGVAQPGAGRERVGQVEVGGVGVAAAEHRGHAALRPAGRRLVQLGLGQHADPHAVRLGRPHRRGQPGHAGAEHEQVERRGRHTLNLARA